MSCGAVRRFFADHFSPDKAKEADKQPLKLLFCRKEAIRTPDPYVPNVVRYQLRYFPISWSPKETPRELCSF